MNRYLFLCLFFGIKIWAQQKVEVFFDFNKSEITQESKQDLLKQLKKDVTVNSVYGYCDNVDSNSYNDSLSLVRARNVAFYLKENQVKFSDSFVVKGFGENFNQSPNQNENRKVIIEYSENPPITVKPISVVKNEILKSKVGDKIVLKNINFYNLSDILLPESKPAVAELIAVMKENTRLVIDIQGHICCQAEDKKISISEARAKRIYTILLQNGIQEERLSYRGYGNKYPIYRIPEKNESEKIANRRVEIEVLEN
jgi:outer membrane protein OmpA-like peptidoglycan-associated protein